MNNDSSVWTYDFKNYVTQNPHAMEVVPWYLYHTRRFDFEQRMEFFGNARYGHLSENIDEQTNMLMPGCLPHPCSYLITGIRIFGLPTALTSANFRLNVGNKIYADTNVMAYIERWKSRDIPLMILPMQYFRAELTWKAPVDLHSNWFQWKTPVITIMFKGQIARAVC